MSNKSIDPRVRIGHVHLKVADLDRALQFYCDVLGFELQQRLGTQAAFISASGYPSSHRTEHMGEQGWFAAVAGHDGFVSCRDSVSDAGFAGGRAAARARGEHRTGRRIRSRRKRGDLSARPRWQWGGTLPRPPRIRMAAFGQRRVGNVYSRAEFGRTVARKSFRLILRQMQTESRHGLHAPLNALVLPAIFPSSPSFDRTGDRAFKRET